jgi:predicted permease
LPAKVWLFAEKLGYYLLMQALIVHQLSGAKLKELNVGAMAAVLVGAVLVMTVLLLALRPWLSRLGQVEGPGFTSIYQGATRSNFFISLVAIEAGFGAAGTARAIIGFALMPPLVNVLSVFVLARYASDRPADLKRIGRMLARNPFLYSAAIGLALNTGGVGRPPLLGPVIEFVSQGALPLALLCVGSSLDFSRMRSAGRAVVQGIALKLAGLPLIAYLMCIALRLDDISTAVATIFHSTPAAAASYVMARQMGGDYALMAGILTLQTAVAAISVPFIMFLFLR